MSTIFPQQGGVASNLKMHAYCLNEYVHDNYGDKISISPYQDGELAESYGIQWVGACIGTLREHTVSGFQTKMNGSTHSTKRSR